MKICSVEGCEKTVKQGGWCNTHYHRWRRSGSTDGVPLDQRKNRPNPLAPEIVALAQEGMAAPEIRKRLGLRKNVVSGILDRAKRRGDLDSKGLAIGEGYPGFPRNPFPDRGCLFPAHESDPHGRMPAITHDLRDPGFRFCCEPVDQPGSAWCSKHRRRVYQRAIPAG